MLEERYDTDGFVRPVEDQGLTSSSSFLTFLRYTLLNNLNCVKWQVDFFHLVFNLSIVVYLFEESAHLSQLVNKLSSVPTLGHENDSFQQHVPFFFVFPLFQDHREGGICLRSRLKIPLWSQHGSVKELNFVRLKETWVCINVHFSSLDIIPGCGYDVSRFNKVAHLKVSNGHPCQGIDPPWMNHQSVVPPLQSLLIFTQFKWVSGDIEHQN